MPQPASYDLLIIGAGAAGLTLALKLAAHLKIALVSKGSLIESSTYFAQGGIAAVLAENDSIEAHVADTLRAGAGLCHRDAVEFTVRNSRGIIEWLIEQGVPFTKTDRPEQGFEDYHLTQEGGHSLRRIIHAEDATGQAVSNALIDRLHSHANIGVFEYRTAVDLIVQQDAQGERRCTGAYLLNQQSGEVEVFQARFTALATGGASKVYLYTSNPDTATGDGIAMAWRAGCRVANMEFNQFHPTCLYHPKAKSFLISEALRGEGARLLLPDGTAFMQRFHPQRELAPRDVVARAIDHEMKRLGIDHVYLDISHQPADFIRSHFPTIYGRCLEFGIDITREPIPVVPAAHYTCGGVVVDLDGATDLPGLYAIGESSCTGLHGANRMASNSLLECLVYAQAAAQSILRRSDATPVPAPTRPWDESRVIDSDEEIVIAHNWEELRRFMWDYVGIVRTDKRLARALRRVELLKQEIADYYGHYKVTSDLLELRNLACVAELIVRCAIARKESRGLHYTLDYPDLLPRALDTVLIPVIGGAAPTMTLLEPNP